ncbi:hypothetical protein FTX61_13265 [Nitriliruptoraceae bacterium ZYF776]|nr:hypothetical protein [Profundirhabdus halotolerans]
MGSRSRGRSSDGDADGSYVSGRSVRMRARPVPGRTCRTPRPHGHHGRTAGARPIELDTVARPRSRTDRRAAPSGQG